MSPEDIIELASIAPNVVLAGDLAHCVLNYHDVKQINPSILFSLIFNSNLSDEVGITDNYMLDSSHTSYYASMRFIIMFYYIHYYKLTHLNEEEQKLYLEKLQNAYQLYLEQLQPLADERQANYRAAYIEYLNSALSSDTDIISESLFSYIEELSHFGVNFIDNLQSNSERALLMIWKLNSRGIPPVIPINLSGIKLIHLDLDKIPLRFEINNFNLTNAMIRGSLPNLTVNNSILCNVDFSTCNLRKFQVGNSQLIGANFTSANLSAAQFSGNNIIKNCIFTNAILYDFDTKPFPVSISFSPCSKMQDNDIQPDIIYTIFLDTEITYNILFTSHEFSNAKLFAVALDKYLKYNKEDHGCSAYHKRLMNPRRCVPRNMAGNFNYQVTFVPEGAPAKLIYFYEIFCMKSCNKEPSSNDKKSFKVYGK